MYLTLHPHVCRSTFCPSPTPPRRRRLGRYSVPRSSAAPQLSSRACSPQFTSLVLSVCRTTAWSWFTTPNKDRSHTQGCKRSVALSVFVSIRFFGVFGAIVPATFTMPWQKHQNGTSQKTCKKESFCSPFLRPLTVDGGAAWLALQPTCPLFVHFYDPATSNKWILRGMLFFGQFLALKLYLSLVSKFLNEAYGSRIYHRSGQTVPQTVLRNLER